MAFFDDQQRRRIAAVIREAESKTSGELVIVLAPASDAYLYIPFLWSALIALALPGVLHAHPMILTAFTVYMVQLSSFLVLSIFLQWAPVKMSLVPSRVKRRRASRLAREQFFLQGVHLTRDRTGILIFVSVAERYVEIIADAGIDKIAPEGTWQSIVDELVVDIKSNQVADGFVKAARACGDLLAGSFPRPAEDLDERPNRLVEL